jgi:hypothetical protein
LFIIKASWNAFSRGSVFMSDTTRKFSVTILNVTQTTDGAFLDCDGELAGQQIRLLGRHVHGGDDSRAAILTAKGRPATLYCFYARDSGDMGCLFGAAWHPKLQVATVVLGARDASSGLPSRPPEIVYSRPVQNSVQP